MTSLESSRRPARPSRTHTVLRVAVVLLALALAFLLGVAFSRTLDERPKSSGTETIVRTLTPVPQGAPDRTVTVTVTVTSP
ncbi:MAG TPA: hypothetical protein VFT35_06215 [Gaiellaceae bacterium]|nr:hypothetical protein [Gaiellaceae bacterium]